MSAMNDFDGAGKDDVDASISVVAETEPVVLSVGQSFLYAALKTVLYNANTSFCNPDNFVTVVLGETALLVATAMFVAIVRFSL
jgi:hypothetical protein